MKTLQIVFSDDKIYNVSLTDENGKVNQLLSGLLQIGQAAAIPSPAEACPEDESVSNNLTLLLNHLGLSPNLKGYYYIKHAVLQVMKDPSLLVGITKKLYPEIVWRSGHKERYCRLTRSTIKDKPTNSQFIGILAEYIKIAKVNDMAIG